MHGDYLSHKIVENKEYLLIVYRNHHIYKLALSITKPRNIPKSTLIPFIDKLLQLRLREVWAFKYLASLILMNTIRPFLTLIRPVDFLECCINIPMEGIT